MVLKKIEWSAHASVEPCKRNGNNKSCISRSHVEKIEFLLLFKEVITFAHSIFIP